MKPRVSVLCSVFDGARHLPAAIASIRGQTYADFEFILIDDGSTDDTPAILEQAAVDDPRVVVITQSHLGLTRALNVGLQAARGELIARQDADDLSLPHRLAAQVAFLDRHPAHLVVGARYQKIDEDGKSIGRSRPPLGDFALRRRLLDANCIAHSSATFRREPILDLGGYDESLPVAQDYDLWCRVAACGKLANLRRVALQRRQHAGRVGERCGDEQRRLRDQIRLRYCEGTLVHAPRGWRGGLLCAAARGRLRGLRAAGVA